MQGKMVEHPLLTLIQLVAQMNTCVPITTGNKNLKATGNYTPTVTPKVSQLFPRFKFAPVTPEFVDLEHRAIMLHSSWTQGVIAFW